jgi:hypothetical protein
MSARRLITPGKVPEIDFLGDQQGCQIFLGTKYQNGEK